MNRILAGALAGIAGTYAMTLAADVLFPRLPPDERYPLPPREITQDGIERATRQPAEDRNALVSATVASHFAYGAGCGVLFTLLRLYRGHPIRNGIGFGLTVWAISYLGWLPAAGILTPASRHPPRRNALMTTVHVAWGAATGHAAGLLMRSGHIFGTEQPETLRDRVHR